MTNRLCILLRSQINNDAWNACVAASPQCIVYGYSWYLDAVLPEPSWKWVGLVVTDTAGDYQAVMPVPLRRKQLAGVTYEWVVYQPFFCQFLAIFCRDSTLDLTPFFQALTRRFRYGSILNLRQQPVDLALFNTLRLLTTHTLDLSVGYKTLYQQYTHDRKANLRRAMDFNWTIIESSDPEPLLSLFRENHADTIPGGVADWAYSLFTNLLNELNQRGLTTIRYAVGDGRVEAGALFVQEGNRIIYLFNAASKTGRLGNARTLLIDQMLQEKSGVNDKGEPLIFDFESPEKMSIRHFYRSFGATEEAFWTMHWSRLTLVEHVLQRIGKALKKALADR